jgi:hypothetical protein
MLQLRGKVIAQDPQCRVQPTSALGVLNVAGYRLREVLGK